MIIYENDKIYVRPLKESDVEKDSYQQWFYDQEVCKYNSHGKFSHGFDHFSIIELNPENHIIWAVIFKEKSVTCSATPEHISTHLAPNAHIGNVILNIDWINRNAEFTCIFGEKEYWGKGYCTQVLKWIIDHGFNKLNLHKIWLGTVNENVGMNSAAVKNGMYLETHLNREVFIEGRYRAINRWAKIND